MDITTTSNQYLMLAEAQTRSGEDMEIVATQLALALAEVIREGLGITQDVLSEFERLIEKD